LRTINGDHGHADKKMSSTSVKSDTGIRTFLVIRTFGNFDAAEEYTRLLEKQKLAGARATNVALQCGFTALLADASSDVSAWCRARALARTSRPR
jgi:hypothetical protein